MKSIMQTEKECYFCLTTHGLHKHHIFFGPNRSNSEKWGCWAWICARHHNMSDNSVHFNKAMDDALKCHCEMEFVKRQMQEGLTKEEAREKFIGIFGRHYIDEEGGKV